MAVYPNPSEPYCCSICGRESPYRWEDPRVQSRAPLCRHCENDYGVGPYNDANPDRRIIKQISALAEAIRVDANCIERGAGTANG